MNSTEMFLFMMFILFCCGMGTVRTKPQALKPVKINIRSIKEWKDEVHLHRTIVDVYDKRGGVSMIVFYTPPYKDWHSKVRIEGTDLIHEVFEGDIRVCEQRYHGA